MDGVDRDEPVSADHLAGAFAAMGSVEGMSGSQAGSGGAGWRISRHSGTGPAASCVEVKQMRVNAPVPADQPQARPRPRPASWAETRVEGPAGGRGTTPATPPPSSAPGGGVGRWRADTRSMPPTATGRSASRTKYLWTAHLPAAARAGSAARNGDAAADQLPSVYVTLAGEAWEPSKQLRGLVDDATAAGRAAVYREANSAGPAPGSEMAQYCDAVGEHIIQIMADSVATRRTGGQVTGQGTGQIEGLIARSTRDDNSIGAGATLRRRLNLPDAFWGSVDNWEDLATAVYRGGAGTVADVFTEQPGTGNILERHRIVIVHTVDDGVVLINPKNPRHPATITALEPNNAPSDPLAPRTGLFPPLINARAVVRVRDGQLIAPTKPVTPESSSLPRILALSTDSRTGADQRRAPVDRIGSLPIDAMNDLIVGVNRALAGLRWTGGQVAAHGIQSVLNGTFVRREGLAPVDPAQAPTDPKGLAVWIAHQISGREYGLQGEGSGPEFERFWQVFLPLRDGEDARSYWKRTLVTNARHDIRIEVEQKLYFRGSNDKFYLNERVAADAGIAGGEWDYAAVIEDVAGPLRTLDEETEYPPVDPVFDETSRTEDRLISLFSDGKHSPVPLSDIFRPEDGYELTGLGRDSLIGPPVVGESMGLHVHHSQGVPLAGLAEILDRIREGSYPERATGSVSRNTMADGQGFGRELAGRFVRWWADKEQRQLAGALDTEALAERFWSIPKVRALWGVAALAYTHAASMVNAYIKPGSLKRNFDVISRNDLSMLLDGLEQDIRDYLDSDIDYALDRFRERYEDRAPDWRDEYRDHKRPWWRPSVGYNILDLPIHRLDDVTIEDYLCTALVHGYGTHIGQAGALQTTTVRNLDDHSGKLAIPQAVIEIRHFGAERVDVETAREQHKYLAGIARREYDAVLEWESSPARSEAHLEALWESVQPTQEQAALPQSGNTPQSVPAVGRSFHLQDPHPAGAATATIGTTAQRTYSTLAELPADAEQIGLLLDHPDDRLPASAHRGNVHAAPIHRPAPAAGPGPHDSVDSLPPDAGSVWDSSGPGVDHSAILPVRPEPLRRPPDPTPTLSRFVVGGGDGPPVEVPRELNFIWLGGRLRESAQANLRAWLKQARVAGWAVRIWTDENAADANAEFFETHFPGRWAERHTITAALFDDRPAAHGASPQRDVYEGALAAEGFAMASDVARYAILRRYGGVYVDVDIAPGRVALPREALRMPRGGNAVPFLGPNIRDGRLDSEQDYLLEQRDELFTGDELVEQVARRRYAFAWFGNSFIVAPPRMEFLERIYQRIASTELHARMRDSDFDPRTDAAGYTGPGLWTVELNRVDPDTAERGQPDRNAGLGFAQPRVDPAMLEQWVGLAWVTPESEFQEAKAPQPTEDPIWAYLWELLTDAPTQRWERVWADPTSGHLVRSAFDVRQAECCGSRLTEVTVAIDLRRGPGVSPAQFELVRRRLNIAVQEHLNTPAHHEPGSSDLLHFNVIPADRSHPAHLLVDVLAETTVMTQHQWMIRQRPELYMLGLLFQLGATGIADMGPLSDFDAWTTPEKIDAVAADLRRALLQMPQTETRHTGQTADPADPHPWVISGGGMLHAGLGRKVLGELVDRVAGGPDGRADLGPDPIDCVVLLNGILESLFRARLAPIPRPADTVDDLAVGTGHARDTLAPGAQWVRVSSWQDVEHAVVKAGVGSTALVLWQRPAGIGHAFALHHTADRDDPLQWIDPHNARGDRLIDITRLPSAVHTRVLILDPTGKEIRATLTPDAPGAPASTSESASAVRAVIDAPTDPRYGRGGVEFEQHSGYLVFPRAINYLSNTVLPFLARHDAYGVEVVVDHGAFTTTATGEQRQRKYPDPANAPVDVKTKPVLEFVSREPFAILPDEPGVSPRLTFDLVRRTLNRIEFVSQNLLRDGFKERTAPLWDILRPQEGWTLHPNAKALFVPVLPLDAADLAMHYTVGVPIAALKQFIISVTDGITPDPRYPPVHMYMSDALSFAQEIVAEFLEQRRLTRQDQTEIEGVLALTYTQVTGLIMTTTVRSAGKSHVAVASRTALRVARNELSERARKLLNDNADSIHQIFEDYFLDRFPGFDEANRAYTSRGGGSPLQPLDAAGARNYLNNVLLDSGYDPVSQGQAMGINTQFADLDRARTNRPGLLLIEVRTFSHQRKTIPQAEEAYRQLENIIRQAVMQTEDIPAPAVPQSGNTPQSPAKLQWRESMYSPPTNPNETKACVSVAIVDLERGVSLQRQS